MKNMYSSWIIKAGTLFSMAAIFFASVAANTTCGFIIYQPKLPKEVEELCNNK